jgi:prepilin-type N-terminal cleavage/methylation domain-containing protein
VLSQEMVQLHLQVFSNQFTWVGPHKGPAQVIYMPAIKIQSGFTLLEILVVIIIVGVLASVAMPTLFRNVERSRAADAFNTIGIIKRHLDGCAMQFGGTDYTNCGSFNAVGMADPSGSTGTHFTYTINGVAIGLYTIRATRNALDNGNSGDTINMILSGGAFFKSGNGAFLGIQ